MKPCRICGEEKEEREFSHIPYFTKYKRTVVVWCHACQKEWLEMRRKRELLKRNHWDETKHTVSFE